MKRRVAINGFGRIGRQALKAILEQHGDRLELAAVGLSDLANARAAAHLLRHDSNYGRFGLPVTVEDSLLCVGDTAVPLVSASRPADLPWRDLGVDVVIESSGAFAGGRDAAGHLEAGARKVVLTTGSEDADMTIIYGLNEQEYDPDRHHLVATDTETTNALAVVLRPIVESFDVRGVLVSAVRAYDRTQKLLDAADADLRRARSAPDSIVPTSSRAATAVGRFVPSLAGKVDGFAVRVPVSVVSMAEMTLRLGTPATAAAINAALMEAATGPLGRVLAVSSEPLVSSDYRRSPFSAVVDLPLTITIGPLAKVSAWYDNEYGFASRVADVTAVVAGAIG